MSLPAQATKIVPRRPKRLFIGAVSPVRNGQRTGRSFGRAGNGNAQQPRTAQQRYGAALVRPRSQVSRYESPPMPNWSLYIDCAPLTTVSSAK